jgi:hypothetical protein
MMSSLTQAMVNERLDAAREHLARASGGAALCRIGAHADADRIAVKWAEGAAAALADLRDAMRVDAGGDDALMRVAARWTDDLGSHHQRGSAPEWIAYCEGGVAALGEVATWRGR